MSCFKMLLFVPLLLVLVSAKLAAADTTTYDRFTGEPVTNDLLAYYKEKDLISTCTVDVEACDPNERSRVDGSCNSLSHPERGTFVSTVSRILPAQYFNDSYARKSIDGQDLPLPRAVRTAMLSAGKASSPDFTQAVPAFSIWMFADTADVHDIKYFVGTKTDCCAAGRNDYECAPNIIPKDDPVHRFTGINCMNLTRPRAWRDFGCTNETVPVPIEYATGSFDSSQVYNGAGDGDAAIRTFKGGLIAMDVDDKGVTWPPNGNGFCPGNTQEETRCFGHASTELLSTMLLSIWGLRHHNFIATKLAKLNPCWDDDQLFYTAREINNGFILQMYFYEWLPPMFGRDNLIDAGVIGKDDGFRDVYDDSKYPVVNLEYVYIQRWFHTIQDATARMYSTDGSFLGEFPYVNVSFRPGYLGHDDNIVKFTPHLWRQPAAKSDYSVDPDLLDRGAAMVQLAVDICTSDLHKSRLLGFPPYIDYVQHFTGHNITTFEDLAQHMPVERIQQLKRVYNYPSDIDLMAGCWAESFIKGGKAPVTVANIFMDYLAKAVRYDRHWYERANRPNAFTAAQLAEIRKASMARFICNSGDQVQEIQPYVFLNIDKKNPLTDCADIKDLDLSAWSDPTCANSNSGDGSDSDGTTETTETTTETTAETTTATPDYSDDGSDDYNFEV